jgi:triacylglycerol esterase/lipase EstA (alpha/beta hydrolase family)
VTSVRWGALARGLLVFRGLELAGYVVLAAWLLTARSWTVAATILLVVSIATGWRVAFALATYVLAWRYRSPTPVEFRRSALGLVPYFVKEAASITAVYDILQPLEGLFMGDTRPPRRSGMRLPVLLVHGYVCNRAVWWAAARTLRAHGETVWAVTLEPVYGSIDDWVSPLAVRIDDLLAATGAAQVVLVAGSMGGLAARAYLRDRGGAKVARLVTLGSPHHGSMHARIGPGGNAREMEPGSQWLAALARSEAAGVPVPFTSVYSHHDNFVAPQTSSAHPAAHNVPLAGVGHLSLAFSKHVLEIIMAELDAANAAVRGKPAEPRAA